MDKMVICWIKQELVYQVHVWITLFIFSLDLSPNCYMHGTCSFLLGNKGMHCYNGNTATGGTPEMTMDAEAICKARFSKLLIEGGCKALQQVIIQIVLNICLQNIDQQTKLTLTPNDLSLLFPGGQNLPKLEGLTQSGLDFVWIKVLKILQASSIITCVMIQDHLATDRFANELKKHEHRLFNLKEKNKILTPAQWDKLFPLHGAKVDLNGMDITLLCSVIRNVFQFKPTSGKWDQMPSDNDRGIGDDIVRLRMHRNDLAHDTSYGMDKKTFNKKWGDICVMLIRLTGKQFYKTCHELYRCDLNPEKAAQFTQLIEEWKQRDNVVLSSVHEMHSEKVVNEISEDVNQMKQEQNRVKVENGAIGDVDEMNQEQNEDIRKLQNDVSGLKIIVNQMKIVQNEELMKDFRELQKVVNRMSENLNHMKQEKKEDIEQINPEQNKEKVVNRSGEDIEQISPEQNEEKVVNGTVGDIEQIHPEQNEEKVVNGTGELINPEQNTDLDENRTHEARKERRRTKPNNVLLDFLVGRKLMFS